MKKNMVQLFMLLLMLLLMSGCEKSKADFGQSENTNQSEIEQNNNMGPNEEINFYGIDMSLSKDEIYSEIGNNNIT